MREIFEINDLPTLLTYRSLWQSLLEETTDACFFQTLDWLEVYWAHYGSHQRLRTLIVYEHGQPLGILPMVVRRERRKVGEVAILTYPLDDWGSFYGPIGPCPEATLAAGLKYFAESQRDWDQLDLRWVADEPVSRAQVESALAQAGLPTRNAVRTTTAEIEIEGTWDHFFQKQPSKWRNNFRRWQRRLAEQGEITFLRYRPAGSAAGEGDPRWDLYDACEKIAQRSWQGSSQTGTTLCHEEVRPFLRDLHAAAARAGGVEINLLLRNGEPIAFAYNYHYRGNVFGLRVGYDPDAARDGAGNVLNAYALEDSIRRGDRVYDMGPGSLEYKRHLATRFVSVLQYTHFNRASVKGQLLYAAHRARHWLRQRKERAGAPQAA